MQILSPAIKDAYCYLLEYIPLSRVDRQRVLEHQYHGIAPKEHVSDISVLLHRPHHLRTFKETIQEISKFHSIFV